MLTNSFEDYMMDQFLALFPGILDDSIEDGFNDWISTLQADDWFQFGDDYKNFKSK